jgi:hypothetical protein
MTIQDLEPTIEEFLSRLLAGSQVILDEEDTDALLRILYNGRKPARVHTLICLCGTKADLRQSPKAWNGWRVLPTAMCPACIEHMGPQPRDEALYPHLAHERFVAKLQQLKAVAEES